jgi:hypothetical protein
MITRKDRKDYPGHTDGSILGIKLIGGLTDEVLLEIEKLGTASTPFEAIMLLMGGRGETNPRWIMGRVAEEMYDRELLSDKKFSALWERYS